ncbi:ATPase family AAA domain-containing protein 5-like [Xyrauchen texanus]|uniref:ATPase family AAA domain-containing protein 5-like n=1 Tax=Xyrauchen texanus TaxID=154827 RepID=UPI0022423485|nr:ATPase family AAA domain-containing protein 5-like [Xyrauchen texanus]
MAGAVAMAAVMEDFEGQPCKKLRKDADAPPVRTITNYFMPKQVEKPFSPPRSNNIMDYFKRALPAQEIQISPVIKENSPQSSEQVRSPEIPKYRKSERAQGQKRTRKRKEYKKIKKEDAHEATDDVVLIENPSESPVKERAISSTNGNDTSALLAQTSHDVSSDKESGGRKKATEPDSNAMKLKNSVESSAPNSPVEDKSKSKKSSVRRNRKAKGSCEETKWSASDAQTSEQPICETKPESSAEKSPMQSSSTIKISFKDFLQNHSQEQVLGNAIPKSDSIFHGTVSEGNTCNDQRVSAVGPVQVSPRTLTIQAEVHPISPDHESVKDSKELKVASIFSRNRKSQIKEDKTLSEFKPDIFPDHKWKSNVVLLEEDLELDVMESSPMLKSTEAERKQFMNAFKQPSLDGLKSKTNKGQNKQNQVQEQVPEAVDKEDVEQSIEKKTEVTSSEQNEEQKSSTGGGKKRVRKPGMKVLAKTVEDAPVPTPKPKELPMEMEVDKKSSPADDDDSKQTVRGLRRSTRELSRRQSAAVLETDATSQKKGKKENKVKDDVTQNTPSLASTPKVHRPKRGIYRAEMVSPLDTKGSPIRMRITRVFPSSAIKAGDFEISSPLATKELNACKKRKRARKLVQKAKAFQQSKKDSTKVKETPRRSSRSKESIINYCEDEESVVFLDQSKSTPVTSQESGKKMKRLRSLNEVLGKVTAQNKESNTPAASKLAPLFVEKKAQRPSGVISIFDDSSQEASENSQDNEQFRAKREFLKSGLPDTFKKQIAKTAASREAYSQACALFQTVVHIQQRASDCSIWNLQWPLNPFLIWLKESYNLPSVPLMILERSFGHTTVATKRTFSQRVSCCRIEISEPVRQHLLEEIRSSNPSFPHQRFFALFIKRCKDYVLQSSASEPEGESKTFCPSGSSESGIGRKRKRADEGERTNKVGKKTKSSHIEGEVILIEGSPPSGKSGGLAAQDVTENKTFGRSRRGRSKRQKQKEKPKPAEVTSPVGNQSDSLITLDSPVPGATGTEDGVKEDVLWSEKYQPQHSDDLIGNLESVQRLHSWLKEWKLRTDREEKRKQLEKKQEEDSNDSWLMGNGGVGLEDMEDLLCNTLLITGPTGVGKTAAVYACAQELGFKVFEVNSSSQRSGRQILSQLKEATQSHQVDIQGINAHKPSYFSNYSSTNSNTRPGNSPRKVNSPRKPPQSPQSAPSRRGGLAPTSLTSFFKAGGRATGNEASNQDKKAQPACPKKSAKSKETDSKSKECPSGTPAGISTEDQGKRTATSLILFEEVDVIFDDDTGFLAAVKTFMTTTKRPVILTTSDPIFFATFDGCFEEIHFKAPSVADVSSYLQLLCLAENLRTDIKDVSSLLEWNRCDIRQSLLHLQFWACSGGGQQVQRPLPSSVLKSEVKSVKDEYSLPPCHTACTESLLGILNVQTENIADSLLKHESSVLESMRCWDLLSEVQRRGVDLLYTNMESLLPLPTQPLSLSTLKSQAPPNPPTKPEQVSQDVSLKVLKEPSDDGSPLKVSSRMRGKKKLVMANKKCFQSDSESEDEFLSLPKPDNAPVQRTNAELSDQSVKESDVSQAAPLKLRCAVLTEADKKKSVPVLQCLSSLAEYMDHISFLDSSMHYQPSQTEGSCRPNDFVWTGAEVKSGMTDELRLQWDSPINGVSAEEIHSALGHLSFRKCRAAITEAWGKAQELEEDIRRKAEEELTLPVALHRQGFSLTQTMPCESRVIERRSEVIKSVLSSRLAGTLGNRAAAALDYLPSLRNICRSERLKEQGKIKRRFLHYLDGIHFTLPKSTVEFLASEFP